MNDRSRAMASAIISAVLFSIGYFMVAIIPGGGEVADEDFTDFYGSDGNLLTSVILFLVLLIGCWALAWFFTELRSRLRDDVLNHSAYGVALIGVTAVAVGGAILLAPGGVQMNSDADFVGAPIAHALAQAGLGVMLFVGMYSLALAVGLFSASLRRANMIPSWLFIAGIVIAVLLIGSFVWLPGYLFPIWVILVGVVGLRRSEVP